MSRLHRTMRMRRPKISAVLQTQFIATRLKPRAPATRMKHPPVALTRSLHILLCLRRHRRGQQPISHHALLRRTFISHLQVSRRTCIKSPPTDSEYAQSKASGFLSDGRPFSHICRSPRGWECSPPSLNYSSRRVLKLELDFTLSRRWCCKLPSRY